MAQKFWQHPLNKKIAEFNAFLWEKSNTSQITEQEFCDILRVGIQIFQASGLPNGPEVSEVTLAVFRQQLHAMKSRLLELHPELAAELQALGQNGPSR